MATAAGAGTRKDRLIGRGIKFRHLRVLAELLETHQVSAAAARLNMTQPTASRLLAEAEEIVGVSLYERHPRGIRFTVMGQTLAERARRLLRDLDQTDREIEEMNTGARGTVSIGAVTGPALEIVLPVIRQARVAHPHIRINVTVDLSDKLVGELLAGNIDFYIGRLPAGIDPRTFVTQSIGEEPLSLVVRDGHPLTHQINPTLEDCIQYDWIMQPHGGLLRSTVESYLLGKGHALPTRVLGTSSILLTLALISSSNGIGTLARAAARFYAAEDGMGRGIVTLPLAEDMRVSPYALIRLRDLTLTPASQTLHDMIDERIETLLRQA
ncbi:MAG: LysR family transcriptional regulator [Rhodospirillum sp.]|nr:LysR family transcriptional regulator [Rhodospirillum sp.]MCF8491034.1 LysR family transcriptional regulator [Rhodospirillum sp.]MCF8500357.1 LysR family transcriptional regulator [Rhodospirillum sp.]